MRANEDISVIHSLVNAGAEDYTSTICFHAQQASEKFMKAFLVYHNINYPRTHDLDYLLLECQKINKEAFEIDFKSLTEQPLIFHRKRGFSHKVWTPLRCAQ